MSKYFIYIALSLVAVTGLAWFVLFRPAPAPVTNTGTPLGTANNQTQVGVTDTSTTAANGQIPIISQTSTQKVFKIAPGPISSAVFIETKNPTTTIARYVQANNGHVFDLAVDVPGAASKSISNTTIPGIMQSQWSPQGNVAILQYLNSSTIKTVSLSLPDQATSTGTTPIRIQFFPDGISEIAVSPNGRQAAYLLRTQTGVDGYIGNADGSGGKKTFSIPLSQILLSWPSQSTLLAQSPSSNGAPGIVFSVNTTNGNVIPILQSNGLIATADPSYTYMIYQSTTANAARHTTYLHNLTTRNELQLSFNPLVEKCTWRTSPITTLFCASPVTPTPDNYADLWHLGIANIADSIFSYNPITGASTVIATPGNNQGGESSDITLMSVSPNGKYLLFIKKGDRSLWGVRLTQ